MTFRTSIIIKTLALGLCGVGMGQNLVTNGDFETIGIAGYSAQIGALPQAPSPLQTVTGWSTTGYNFLFLPGTGTTTGAKTGFSNQLTFWGSSSQNGGASTFDFPANSPSGGNFIALDGGYAPNTQPLVQTVGGLVTGGDYELTFYWAAAQQKGFNGATTEGMQVTFGGQTFSTSTYNLPSHGFSGWMSATMNFTATAGSQTLSFLAKGTPEGLPPFTLLDGVSVVAVPEASASAMIMLGMTGLLFVRRRRSVSCQ